MSRTLAAIEADALQLTPDERITLAERLIASLPPAPDIDAAWAAELDRRQAEIDTGAVSLVSGPEALARLRAEFT